MTGKDRVSKIETKCRITGVENPVHLIASHCKPWRDSTNEERLDGENGLLLTPSIDHLFDRGFIGFEDNGKLIISPVAHQPSLQAYGNRHNRERARWGIHQRSKAVSGLSQERCAAPVDAEIAGSFGYMSEIRPRSYNQGHETGKRDSRRAVESGLRSCLYLIEEIGMTTSSHNSQGYELVLHHESDDRYQVTIFDPKGNRIASTGTHLERQGALTEASRYVKQLLAQRRAT